jgi:NADPH2:quinone reductase
MPRAIRIHAPGGPEAMQWEEVAVGDPGPAKRGSGTPPSASTTSTPITERPATRFRCPSGLGSEGAGVVEAVGSGVDWVKAGDRVAYCGGPLARTAKRA